MTRSVSLTESAWCSLAVTIDEQHQLETAGRLLARGTDRHGRPTNNDASLVQVHRVDHNMAEVRVVDAVGLVAIPSLVLHVLPKVPVTHLLHILQSAYVLPRLGPGWAQTTASKDLAELVAQWYVAALERVLEEGLARDYREHRDDLPTVRGRLLSVATAQLYYRGRVAVAVQYEEYDFDTPLNRVLLHAARSVVGVAAFPAPLRQRALRCARRMRGVGTFSSGDLGTRTDRRTSYYRSAFELARQVLLATGRSLGGGDTRSSTFLIRTAAPVEQGLRAEVAARLRREASVRKQQILTSRGDLSLSADLVFVGDDGRTSAIADVKYKLAQGDWRRPDLYEVVAFAAGYDVEHAAVMQFDRGDAPKRSQVVIGKHCVTELLWPAQDALPADVAARIFGDRVAEWYAYATRNLRVDRELMDAAGFEPATSRV